MAKELQIRHGNTTEHSSFVGAPNEITVNTDNKALRVHDGITLGGFEQARADLNNVTNSSFAAKATAAGISGGSNGATVSGADPNATYLLISTDGALSNSRTIQAGNGITLADGGAGGGLSVGVKLSNSVPSNLGSAAIGTSSFVARADHIHAMPTAVDVSAVPNTRVIQAGNGITVSNSGLLTSNTTITLNAGISNLVDVSLTNLSNNQILIFNGATNQWNNFPYSGNLSVKQANVTIGTANAINTLNFTGNGITVVAGTDPKTINLNVSDIYNQSQIQDMAGTVVTSGTHPGMSITYDSTGKKVNFAANSFSVTLTGPVQGTATVTNLSSISLATTISSHGINLGTDTTGNYVGTIAADVNSNGIVVVNTGGISNTTSTLSLNLLDLTFVEGVQDVIGAMLTGTGSSQTGLTVSYNDVGTGSTGGGKLQFAANAFTLTVNGAITGAATITNLASATLTASIAAGAVTLGTHTTGNYVATLSPGATGNGIVVTGSGSAGATPTVALDLSNATFIEGVQDIVGTMVTNGTQSGISVIYNDTGSGPLGTGWLNFDVNDPIITLTGAVTGTAQMVNLANVSIATSYAAGSIILGTHTTGDYIANVSAQDGIKLLAGNAASAGANITISMDPTNPVFIENIQDTVGTFITGSTHTNINVTYDDAGNKLNFAVNTVGLSADLVDGYHANALAILAAPQNSFLSSANQEILLDSANGNLSISNAAGGAAISLKNLTSESFDVRLQESTGGLNVLTTASGVLSVNGNVVYHAGNIPTDTTFMESVEDTVGGMLSGGTQSNGVSVTYADNGPTGRGKLNFAINGGQGSLLNADLVDGFDTSKSETSNTVVIRDTSGGITAQRFIANSTTPNAIFKNTSAVANTGKWQIGPDTTSFSLILVNDAENSSAPALQLTRNSGTNTAAAAKFALTDNLYVTQSGTDYKVFHGNNLTDAVFIEGVQDAAAAMVTAGIHTNITVTYDDPNNRLNFAVNTVNLNADTLDGFDSTAFPRKAESNAIISAQWRHSADIGLDAGKTIWFGREELFGGTDIGTGDYGYITWDNDNNNYAISNSSSENGCLRIGVANDPTGSLGDSLAMEPSADLFLNPTGGLYFGNAATRQTIWHAGNDGSGSALDSDLLDGQHGSFYQNASNLNAGTIAAAQMPAHTGDVSSAAGSTTLTLATVNTNIGSFGSATQAPQITVDAKGRITAVVNQTVTPAWASITSKPTTIAGFGIVDAMSTSTSLNASQMPGLTGDVSSTPGTVATTLATVNSNVGTYGNAAYIPSITVDGKGRVTSVVVNAATPAPGSALTASQNNFTQMQIISASNSVTQQDYLELKPTDYTTNKPLLYMRKSTSATSWEIGMSDGSTNTGTINFNVTGLTWNGTGLMTTSTGVSAPQMPALTGDISTSSGSVATTLATVNSNTGSWGTATQAPQITVDGKGRITAATNITITPAFASITSKPTTVSGYGITDAVDLSSNQTVGGLKTFSGNVTAQANVFTNTDNVHDIGQSATRWRNVYAVTFTGTATSAQYADVAERYSSDAPYEPGTVVVFGGSNEVTQCTNSHDTAVAGVISTAPAYMMNSDAGSDATHPFVALVGRVPCKVLGPVKKGDLLTTSELPGYAKKVMSPVIGCIVGKAMEDFGGTEGVIEISVQRS